MFLFFFLFRRSWSGQPKIGQLRQRPLFFAPKKSSTELLHVTMGPCLEAVPIATLAAFFWSRERRYSMSLWRRRWRNLLSQLILSQFFVPSSIASCHFKSSRLELKFSRCFQTLQARMLTKPRSLHSNCSKSAIPLSSWRSLNNQTLQYIYSSVYSLWATGRPWKKMAGSAWHRRLVEKTHHEVWRCSTVKNSWGWICKSHL